MSTSHENALESFGNPARRKGTATHYANGKPKVIGKTQKQIKADLPKAGTGMGLRDYKTDTSHAPPPKKDRWGWAGRVGQAYLRNQKAEHEKGYREDYK